MKNADLELLPLPSADSVPGGILTIRDAHRLRSELVDPRKTRLEDGVRYWKSNDAVVPTFVYKDAYVVCPPEQKAARDKDVAESMSAYRKQRAKTGYSDEELFEMRAAFGPGAEVVDAITGKTIKL